MWDQNAEPLFYGFRVQRFRVPGSAPPLAASGQSDRGGNFEVSYKVSEGRRQNTEDSILPCQSVFCFLSSDPSTGNILLDHIDVDEIWMIG